MMHLTAPPTERPRPAVVAVHHALRGTLPDAVLRGLLDELRADPAWIVLEPFDRPPERIVQMVYRSTGTPYAFRARPGQPGLWHFTD